jgi:mannuronan synthase
MVIAAPSTLSHHNNVVHESEQQRQHIRIQIPAIVKIDGEEFNLANLSASGFKIHITTPRQAFSKTKTQDVEIAFNFDSFAFALKVKADFVHVDNKKGEAGFRFVNLDRQQTSMLHHVIRSYLAGQILSSENILGVASRDNFVAPNRNKSVPIPGGKGSWKKFVGMTVLTLIGTFSILLLTGNIYESAAIVKSYNSVIDGNVLTLRAKSNGVFRSYLTGKEQVVTKDQEIGVFVPDNKSTLAPGATGEEIITSPCDCIITQHSARSGEFKATGEALFKLLPRDEETWVMAVLPAENIHRLKIMDDARIRVVGESNFMEGNIVQFVPQEGEYTKVRIRTKEPINPELVGRPAYVELEAF